MSADGSHTTTAPRRFGIAVVALAVAVGLLLGYGIGWLVPRLTAPGDDSAEAGFARDMINHHAQAVEMGLMAYQRSPDEQVRQIAIDIATAQQGEIGAMQTWLRHWGLEPTGSRPAMAWMPEGTAALQGGLMPGMATGAQMTALRDATGEDFDVLFCQLMLQHHLGGIHMVEGALQQADDPEVRRLAEVMKAGQSREITVLRDLLEQMGAKPL